MQGRRVYPPAPSEDFPHPLPLDYQPGDYWFDPTLGYWFACCPKCGVGSLQAHQVTEHEDGTITVSPSILQGPDWRAKSESWHGFLEHGIWREV